MFWNVSTKDKNAKYQYFNVQNYKIYGQSVLKVYIQAFYTVRKVLYISGDLDQ